MKNPFIAMALMVAAMREQMREAMGYKEPTYRTRIPGKRQPAGSKMTRRAAGRSLTLKWARDKEFARGD